MTITTNLQGFSKYANNIQVGPINGTQNGAYTETSNEGAAYYIGENQHNSVITDGPTYNSLNNSVSIDPNLLTDFSLFVSSPTAATSLEISMHQLYDAIGIAMIGNTIGEGIIQPTWQNPVNIGFGAIDVVGNGQIGKMIILGSDLIPLASIPPDNQDETVGGDDSSDDGGDDSSDDSQQ